MRARRWIFTASLLWWLIAPPARAQQAPEPAPDAEPGATQDADTEPRKLSKREARRRARKLSREFQRLYSAEKYDQAVPVLEEIMRLDPKDVHLFNLGLLHYHRGDKERSLEAFQQFLAAEPRDRGLVREARRFDRILERDVHFIQEIRRKSQARVDQAEREAEQAERDAAQAQAAAEQAERARAQMEADIAAAQEALTQAEAERDQPGDAAGAGKRMLGSSLLVLGGLAVGAGAFYGLDVMQANQAIEEAMEWGYGYEWLMERAESHEQRALIFSLAGAGIMAAGATFYYLGERDARQPSSERMDLRLTPAVGPDGAGVHLRGSF